MQEKIIFREMLSELKELAEQKHGSLSQQEIREFFGEAHLEESHFEAIYEYLNTMKIKVEGYKKVETQTDKGDSSKTDMQKEASNIEKKITSREEDGFLEMYKEDLERIVPLTEEEEFQAYVLSAEGDPVAKSRLVEHYLRLVPELVRHFPNEELLKSDLIQEGNIGLMLAVDNLPGGLGLKSCREYIKEEICTAFREAEQLQRDLKHQDQRLVEQVNYVNEAIQNLETELEHKVSLEELSAYLEMPAEELTVILKIAGDEIELEEEAEDHPSCGCSHE